MTVWTLGKSVRKQRWNERKWATQPVEQTHYPTHQWASIKHNTLQIYHWMKPPSQKLLHPSKWGQGGVHPEQVANVARPPTHPHTHALFWTKWRWKLTYEACFWTLGGNQRAQTKPTKAWGEKLHTKRTQQGFEPSHFELSANHYTMCSPKVEFNQKFVIFLPFF